MKSKLCKPVPSYIILKANRNEDDYYYQDAISKPRAARVVIGISRRDSGFSVCESTGKMCNNEFQRNRVRGFKIFRFPHFFFYSVRTNRCHVKHADVVCTQNVRPINLRLYVYTCVARLIKVTYTRENRTCVFGALRTCEKRVRDIICSSEPDRNRLLGRSVLSPVTSVDKTCVSRVFP